MAINHAFVLDEILWQKLRYPHELNKLLLNDLDQALPIIEEPKVQEKKSIRKHARGEGCIEIYLSNGDLIECR